MIRINKIAGILAVFLLLGTTACGNATGNDKNVNIPVDTEKPDTELNERQTRILEEQGLSTDYEKLTKYERTEITSIEQMLEYMETKYEREFIYSGYAPQTELSEETLICYAADMSSSDEVTVTRNYTGDAGAVDITKYEYEDNFECLLANEAYGNALKALIDENIPDGAVLVLTEVDDLSDDYNGEKPLKYASGHNLVIIDADKCSQAEFESMTESVQQAFLSDFRGMPSETIYYYLVHEAAEQVNAYNYEKILRNNDFYSLTGYINSSGTANIE